MFTERLQKICNDVSYDAGLKVVDQQTAQLVCEIEVWLHFRVCVLTLAEV